MIVYVGMDNVTIVYMGMAYMAMAYIGMACIVMAEIVKAHQTWPIRAVLSENLNRVFFAKRQGRLHFPPQIAA